MPSLSSTNTNRSVKTQTRATASPSGKLNVLRSKAPVEKEELPSFLKDSVVLSGVHEDSEFKSTSGRLSFKGGQKSFRIYQDGKEVVVRVSNQKSGTNGKATFIKNPSGQWQERYLGYGRDGKPVVYHRQDGSSQIRAERTQDGKTTTEILDRETGESVGRQSHSAAGTQTTTFSEGPSGNRTLRTTGFDKDGYSVSGLEVKDATGRSLSKYESLEKQLGPQKTEQIITRHTGGKVESQKTTTSKTGSYLSTVTEKHTNGKIQQYDSWTVSDPISAKPSDLNVEGLGIGWYSPQKALNSLKADGPLSIQKKHHIRNDQGFKSREDIVTWKNSKGQLSKISSGEQATWVYDTPEKTEVRFQGSKRDKIDKKRFQDGKWAVENTTSHLPDHQGAKKGRIPVRSSQQIRKGENLSLQEVAEGIGLPDRVTHSEEWKSFLKSNPGATLAARYNTSHETFKDGDVRSGKSLVLDGANSQTLRLVQDSEGLVALEVTTKGLGDENLRRASVIDQRGRQFPIYTPTKGRDGVDAAKDSGEFLSGAAKFRGKKLSRLEKVLPRFEAVTAGLEALSAVDDLSKGDFKNFARHSSMAARDLGSFAVAASETGVLTKSGKLKALKGLGAVGAAWGAYSGVENYRNGNKIKGSLEVGSSFAAMGALVGVPGVGWAAGGLALGSEVYGYYADTRMGMMSIGQ